MLTALTNKHTTRCADMILIAPAIADIMARLMQGRADDLLTAVSLVTEAPIVLAPAMNQGMWQDTATITNQQALQQKGIYLLGPAAGSQACGDIGLGRMLEPVDVISDEKNCRI